VRTLALRRRKIYRYSRIAKHKLFKEKVLSNKALLNNFENQKLMNDYNSILALNILGLNLSNSSIIISEFKNPFNFNSNNYFNTDSDSLASHILFFKNNTVKNSINTEVINLKSKLPLKIN